MCISVDKNIMLKWLAFLLLAGQSLSLSLKKPVISFDKYHNQTDLENLFNQLAENYPDKVDFFCKLDFYDKNISLFFF